MSYNIPITYFPPLQSPQSFYQHHHHYTQENQNYSSKEPYQEQTIMQVRPAVLTALAFSTIAFILGLLTLLAGIPGFMEYAAVLRVSFSSLFHPHRHGCIENADQKKSSITPPTHPQPTSPSSPTPPRQPGAASTSSASAPATG
jgi:hypothetical protein